VIELQDVDPERRSGVALDEIYAQGRQWARENRRPRALTAADALAALQFEVLFVAVCAGNIAEGYELTDDDRERLRLTVARVNTIADEVIR
jgi:hypothetical protein